MEVVEEMKFVYLPMVVLRNDSEVVGAVSLTQIISVEPDGDSNFTYITVPSHLLKVKLKFDQVMERINDAAGN